MKNILTILFVFTCLFASSQTQFLGAPNVTVVARGNMKVDSILYLPKRQKTPTDTGALRYQISDSSLYVWTGNAWRKAKNDGTVTSVGLTMPSAFNVANSPVTSSGTIAVTAAGTTTQYIRGDGTLAAFPESSAGGAGVSYYLNGSVSQGTIGGSTYYEMNKEPVIGAGTNFTSSSDGLIAQFITDAGDPNRLQIPAGAWNFEMHFSASSGGGSPTFYVELLKYSGTTFTSIASSSTNPRSISEGTTTTLYLTSLAVPQTTLLAADRLAVRVYVAVSGRTITFHTEDNNLAEIITTFSGGISALNGLTSNTQYFAVDTLGTDFNISSVSETHTFNIPTASSTKRGLLSSANWSTFNNKVNISDTSSMLTNYIRHAGFGLLKSGQALLVDTASIATRSRVQKGIDSVANIAVKGTGITGYISKWTGAKTTDTSQLFQLNGFAGVGTVSPAYKLDISGDVRSTTSAFFGTTSGNIGLGIGSVSAWGAPYRVIQGIGSGAIAFNSTNGIDIYQNAFFDGSSLKYITTNLATRYESSLGRHIFYYAPSGTAGNTLTFTEGFRLNSDGNFGIGTASPSYKLDITGTLRNTTGAAFATSSGNVLVGTTVDGGSYKLDVQGALRNTTGAFLATSSGNLNVGGTTDQLAKIGATITNATKYNPSSTFNTGGSLTLVNLSTTDTTFSALTFQSIGSGASAGLANITGLVEGNGKGVLTFGTRNTSVTSVGLERMRINADGLVGINTTAPTERLDVNGRARVRTIDSTGTGTAMNILYADATGVIKKAAVPSGGSGTVTSVATGFGLSGGTITTTGTLIVDSASVATRARVQKGVDSVAAIAVKGTGITGYFPKWTGTGTQDTSQLFQLGRNIGIGTASPTYRLHLPDAGATANQAMIAGTIFGSDGNGITISPNSSNITIKGGQGNGLIYSGTISSVARWGINTTSISDAVLSINGDVKIVTVDSTSTARNMLYQDANGIIKKSAVPSGGVSGSGTTSYLPKWTSGTGLGNSVAYDNGGEIIINSTSDAGDFKLQVVGNIYTSGTITTASPTADPVRPWKLGSRQAATVVLDATQYLEVEVNGTYYRLAIVSVL